MEYDQIYEVDCLDGMLNLESNAAPLIIGDSPYGIGKDFGSGIIWKDFASWFKWIKERLLQCKRVLRRDGSLFLYSSHQYVSYLDVYLRKIGLQYRRKIIWYYENGKARQTREPITQYEPILWFTKSDNYYYKTIREPYKSIERLRHKIIKEGQVWIPNPEGRKVGDVWKIPTLAGKRFEEEKTDHPTQKPLALCDRIVKHFSQEGDLVVIPFAGSGSECVSCKKYKRHFIAFEIVPKWVELSRTRVAATRVLNERVVKEEEQFTQSSLDIFTMR